MPYVTGIATITIEPDGHRTVTTRDLQVNPNPKPLTLEASGSDVKMWREQIRENVPGTYETLAHFGGATALLVPRRAVALPDPDFLGQMVENFGELGKDALLGAVRTGASAATQFCVDTCGGMFTTLDWSLEAALSIPKILVFKPDGWVRIRLPEDCCQLQDGFDEAQQKRWSVVRPDFASKYEAQLVFLLVGYDSFMRSSSRRLVVFGPLGDCQFIRVAHLELEGEGFRFCDAEWRTGRKTVNPEEFDPGPVLLPLHRQIVAVTTVAKHPGKPLILQLDASGQLHPGGLHVFVDGELNRRLVSHNPARVLGSHGLGWLA